MSSVTVLSFELSGIELCKGLIYLHILRIWLTLSVWLCRVTGIVFAAVIAEPCHFVDRFQMFLPALMCFSGCSGEVEVSIVCMVQDSGIVEWMLQGLVKSDCFDVLNVFLII